MRAWKRAGSSSLDLRLRPAVWANESKRQEGISFCQIWKRSMEPENVDS